MKAHLNGAQHTVNFGEFIDKRDQVWMPVPWFVPGSDAEGKPGGDEWRPIGGMAPHPRGHVLRWYPKEWPRLCAILAQRLE